MRIVFSVVGLLVVVAVVGMMAKRQLLALQPVAANAPAGAVSAAEPQAQGMQRQAAADVKKELDAGMQRTRDAAEAGK